VDDEKEYLAQLKQQRHMYQWCLREIGKLSETEARVQAKQFYKYESQSGEHRTLVFHDDAWHWAMLKIYGENYWVEHPELAEPSSDYESECVFYEGNIT